MPVREFFNFVREQGVVGLAIGFIIGGVSKDLVTSLVSDIINPLLGLLLPRPESIAQLSWTVGSAEVRWGNFLMVLLNFVVMCAVVFVGVRLLQISKLDKPKKS